MSPVLTYYGRCCREWLLAVGAYGRCGLCGKAPSYDRPGPLVGGSRG